MSHLQFMKSIYDFKLDMLKTAQNSLHCTWQLAFSGRFIIWQVHSVTHDVSSCPKCTFNGSLCNRDEVMQLLHVEIEQCWSVYKSVMLVGTFKEYELIIMLIVLQY